MANTPTLGFEEVLASLLWSPGLLSDDLMVFSFFEEDDDVEAEDDKDVNGDFILASSASISAMASRSDFFDKEWRPRRTKMEKKSHTLVIHMYKQRRLSCALGLFIKKIL